MRKRQWVPPHRHTNPLTGGALNREDLPILEKDGCAPRPSKFPFIPPEQVLPAEFCCTQTVTNGGAQDIRAEAPFRYTFPGDTAHKADIHIASFSVTGDLPGGDWVGLSLAHAWNGGSLSYAAIKSQVTVGHPGYPGGTQNVCWNAGGASECSGTEGGTPPTFVTSINNPGGGGTNTLEIFGISGLSGSTANVTFCLLVGDVYDQATGLVVPNDIEPTFTGPTVPAPGQPIPLQDLTPDPDGATDTFTFPYPFADYSLVFLHDANDQTAHIASFDGVVGTIVLDYFPDGGSTLRARALGR